jgi:O-antigen/teichoic acid export membrane protein
VTIKEEHKRVAKEGGFAWVFSLIGALVRYGNSIILTRMLGAKGFGFYALANTIVTVTAIATSFGFPTSLVHFVAKDNETRQYGSLKWFVGASVRVTLIVSFIIVLALLLLVPFISDTIFRKSELSIPLFGLALSIPFLALYNVKSSVLQGLRKIRKRVFIERIAHPLLYSILLLMGAYYFKRMEFVLSCFFLSALVVFALSHFWSTQELKAIPNEEAKVEPKWRTLFSFSTPILFLNFLNFFILQSDIIVMGLFRSAKEVGIYAIASRLAQGAGMPADSLGASLAPSFSAMTGKDDHAGLANVYKTSTRWIFMAASFVSLLLIFGSETILSIFGKDFQHGVETLCILTVGQLFSAAFGTNGTLITQTGHPKVNLFNAIVMGTGNILLLSYLVPKYGALGAATASAASLILLNIARSVEIEMILKISPWNKTILKPLLALLAGVLAGYLSLNYSHFIALVCSTISFAAVLILLGFEIEDKEMWSRALAKISPAKQNG